MKKLLLITILLFSIFLISCSENFENPISDNSQYTSISISLDKNFIPSNVLTLNLVLTGTTTYDTTINLKDNPNIVLNWDSLPAATWRLGYSAYDSVDRLLYKGSANIFVSKGIQSKLVLKEWGNSILKPAYNWIDSQGPVFAGSGLSLDTFGVTQPTILYEDGVIKMWYVGLNQGKSHIFYASSLGGNKWDKYLDPVLSPSVNNWDNNSLLNPKVIKVSSRYVMYYNSNKKIGIATSLDGIHWEKEEENVMIADMTEIVPEDILYVNNTYYCYYVGLSNNFNKIYVATSANGYNFSSVGLTLNVTYGWEGSALNNLSVYQDSGIFKAVYTDITGTNIGYAESNNGINWTKTTYAVFGYDSLQANWGRSFTGLSLKRVNDELKIFFSAKVPNQNLYKIGILSKKK